MQREDGWQPTLTMTSPECQEPHQPPGGQELKAGRGSRRENNRFDKKERKKVFDGSRSLKFCTEKLII